MQLNTSILNPFPSVYSVDEGVQQPLITIQLPISHMTLVIQLENLPDPPTFPPMTAELSDIISDVTSSMTL